MRLSARAVLVRLSRWEWDQLEEMIAEGQFRSMEEAIQFAAFRLVSARTFHREAGADSAPEAKPPFKDGAESDEED